MSSVAVKIKTNAIPITTPKRANRNCGTATGVVAGVTAGIEVGVSAVVVIWGSIVCVYVVTGAGGTVTMNATL